MKLKLSNTLWAFRHVALSTLSILLVVAPTSGQSPGNLDLSFDPGAGLGGTVDSVTVQPDGKVIVGGGFKNIARLNPDGTLDSSFNAEASGEVAVIGPVTFQPDGKILMGGRFSTINGTSITGVARLHPDGGLDSSFNPGSITGSFDYRVHAVVLQPDGKVLIGGLFNTVQGISRNGIARLHPDGSLDNSFDPGTGVTESEFTGVYSIALLADGKILIGGAFRKVDGVERAAIARLNWDGSLDSGFIPPSGPPPHWPVGPRIRNFVVQPDGKIITDALQRLNADGSMDHPRLVEVAGGEIYGLALQPDGKLLISGDFTSVNGTAMRSIARIHANGTLDMSFHPGTGPGHMLEPSVRPRIYTVKLQADGKLLVGGYFTSINGINRDGIARLNPDGSLDLGFDATGSGPNEEVQAVVPQPDGKVLIGGQFTEVQRTSRPRIARLHPDGSLDRTFDPGTGLLWKPTPNQTSVSSLDLQSDGKVLITGRFSHLDGVSRSGIARLHGDGSLDTGFNPILDSSGELVEVLSFALQPDGKILIGGEFQAVNGASRNRIARLHPDGTLDSTFDPGIGPVSDTPWYPPTINNLVPQPDGRIVVHGEFTQFSGVPKDRVARLNPDGSLDSGYTVTVLARDGGSGSIAVTSMQPDGKVLIGGNFSTVNGVSRNRVARLNSDGTLDSSFDPGTGVTGSEFGFVYVYSIATRPDGKILIGGEFTHVNGTVRNGIARLHSDGSLDDTFDPGTGPNRAIRSIALQPNGKVLIGGAFIAVDNVGRWRVARLHGNELPPALYLTGPQRLPNGMFRSVISGEPGRSYTIQISTDLALWSDLETIVSTTGSFEFTDNTSFPVPWRFYRVKTE
jgi:uncharacterized delta-60 repeat protein